MNLKDIHIGNTIEARWKEMDISIERTCNFFKLDSQKISEMFKQKHMNSEHLLKWSKLLDYDFFRLYSQHLILYSPPIQNPASKDKKGSSLPIFRKSLYTKEIITFVLEQLETGQKTKQQVIDEYRIPKTTLYKWISKYQ